MIEELNSKQAVKGREWWCIDLGQSELLEKDRFDRLSESFLRFTPDLLQGRNRVFLEMSRTKKLFNLNTITTRARILGQRLGVDSTVWRFGIGKTIPEAWVQTRHRTLESKALPLEAYYDFIHPLTSFELNRPMRERISVFRALGMRALDSLFTIPKEAWLVRFGEEFDSFLENYEHGAGFAWDRFVSSAPLIEKSRWNAEDTVIDSDGLIFRIKPILDRLSERLHSLQLALKKLEITLKLDRAVPDRKLTLSFAFPQTSRVLLLKLLREKISREMERNPLSDPVVEAEISVLETVKRERVSDRFAFSEKDERLEQDQERWLELVAYLGLKLKSREDVFQAETTEHLLPEKSWKRVLLNNPDPSICLDRVSHVFAKRPVRLFSSPISLGRAGEYLKIDRERYRIREISEPEHLSGYAWDVENSGGFDRTYYRVKVETEQGGEQEWWIYKDEQKGKLALHGVY